jgi:hypothetical protein
VGRILYNIFPEVLLYIVAAMELVVGCLPRDTWCWHYPVFVSTTTAVLSGEEVVVVVAVVAETLALRVPTFASEGPLLLVVALLGLLFLVQSVVAWLEIFSSSPFTWTSALAWDADAHSPSGGAPAHSRWLLQFLL